MSPFLAVTVSILNTALANAGRFFGGVVPGQGRVWGGYDVTSWRLSGMTPMISMVFTIESKRNSQSIAVQRPFFISCTSVLWIWEIRAGGSQASKQEVQLQCVFVHCAYAGQIPVNGGWASHYCAGVRFGLLFCHIAAFIDIQWSSLGDGENQARVYTNICRVLPQAAFLGHTEI